MVERWSRLTRRQSRSWEHRAEKAAWLLGGCDFVVDIGAGRMLLEKHLEPGTRYVPVDVVRRDQRTIVVDLNDSSEWPEAVIGDAAEILGVVEYLYDLERFMGRLKPRFDRAVVSYSVSDLSGLTRAASPTGGQHPLPGSARGNVLHSWLVRHRCLPCRFRPVDVASGEVRAGHRVSTLAEPGPL